MRHLNQDTIAFRRAERWAEKKVPREGTITRAMEVHRLIQEYLATQLVVRRAKDAQRRKARVSQ